MRWTGRLLVLAAVVMLGGGWPGIPAQVESLSRVPVDEMDPALPAQPFGVWLMKQLPRGAVPRFSTGTCGASAAGCIIIEANLVSRARWLELMFDLESLAFLGGSISGPGLDRTVLVMTLADLSGQLAQPIRPLPLDCPADTVLKLQANFAGLDEWCEDAAGHKQGPARGWFSTGRYLMYKGSYVAGERNGRWIECDRFERCADRTYR